MRLTILTALSDLNITIGYVVAGPQPPPPPPPKKRGEKIYFNPL